MIHWGYAGRHHAHPVVGAPALAVEGLSVRYAGTEEDALKEVDLRVEVGQRVALVGANGSGKSTLLKAAAGLLPTPPGRVRIYGNAVGACHHRVAYLEQRSEVDWSFPVTVERLVMGGRYVHLGWFRHPGAEDRAAVEVALRRLGLTGLARRQIGALSGGQQQRALLARALAQEADLLLFDEPLTALDGETQGALLAVLRELHREGKTLVMATHDLDRVEAELDRAFRFDRGRVQVLS